MEIQVKAKKIGGSIGIIIPIDVILRERISPDDVLKLRLEKTDELNFLWAVNKDIKKSAKKIMEEIDEGENE